jgi:WD40 repeat protein
LAWSPDGKLVAATVAASTSSVEIWEASSGALRATLALPRPYDRHDFYGALGVAWRPDGGTVALLSPHGDAIQLWDTASWSVRGSLAGKDEDYDGMAWSPDGSTLATIGRRLQLWDGSTGALRATLGDAISKSQPCPHRPLSTLAWSPDGKTLASAGCVDQQARLWDVSTGAARDAIPYAPGGIKPRIAWSPDGSALLMRGEVTRVRDIAKKEFRAKVEGGPTEAEWSPDSASLARFTQLADGTYVLEVVDAKSGELRGRVRDLPPSSRFAWSPTGGAIAAGERTVRLWDGRGPSLRAPVAEVPTGPGVAGMALRPDGRMLAIGLGGPEESRLLVLDGPAGSVRRFPLPEPPKLATDAPAAVWHVSELSFSPDGKTLAGRGAAMGKSHSSADTLLWDVESGSIRVKLPGIDGSGVCGAEGPAVWSPDGTAIAITDVPTCPGPPPRALRVWAATGELRWSFREPKEFMGIPVAWSPDGTTLAVVGESVSFGSASGRLELRDARTGRVRASVKGVNGYAYSGTSSFRAPLAWSEDGSSLLAEATGSSDGKAVPVTLVLDGSTGAERARLDGGHGVRNANGVIASVDKDIIRLLDASTGAVRATLAHPRVEWTGWSGDGRTLMSRSPAEIRLWEGATGAAVRTIPISPPWDCLIRREARVNSQVVACMNSPGSGLRLLRASDGSSLWIHLFVVDGRDVALLYTDSGLVDGDPAASHHLRFRRPNLSKGLIRPAQLPAGFRHPNLLADFLEGRPLDPPPRVPAP